MPHRPLPLGLTVACLLAPLLPSAEPVAAAPSGSEKVLAVVEDFEKLKPGLLRSIWSWNWTEEQKKNADQYSGLEVVAESASGQQCLRLQIRPDMPWDRGYHGILSLGSWYFPPEADALRMRVKVLKGKFSLCIGGPTAYYADSDVYTRVERIEAAADPKWVTLEFSLNHRLWRNFRRSSYSTLAPHIYYTRWAQEPAQVCVLRGSEGEMLLDQIELVAQGEGRPYPTFKSTAVTLVKALAGFEQEADLTTAFTALLADNQVEQFELSWTGGAKKPKWPPPQLSFAREGPAGQGALKAQSAFSEEISWVGAKVSGAPGANALRATIRMVDGNEVVGQYVNGAGQPLDILVLVAPQGALPWERFEPSKALREGPTKGYDYNLSYRTVRDLKDVSFALYQARRFARNGEWTSLVIPFSDFACIYGLGACAEHFQKQRPLAGADLAAILWCEPFPRAHRESPATIWTAELSLVAVPGQAQELRSFYRVPDVSQFQIVKDPSRGLHYGGIAHMLPLGEALPSP